MSLSLLINGKVLLRTIVGYAELHVIKRRCNIRKVVESLTLLTCILYLCLNLVYEEGYLHILLLDHLSEFGDDMSHLCQLFLYECSVGCHYRHSHREERSKRV